MFESPDRLGREIQQLLVVVSGLAEARYGCLLEPGRVLFETGAGVADGGATEPLAGSWRARFEAAGGRLFELPGLLESGAPTDDLFAECAEDGFLFGFLSGRIALALVCAEPEAAQRALGKPFEVLADRLFRWRPAYRGRALFFGSPRVDWVRIERPAADDTPA